MTPRLAVTDVQIDEYFSGLSPTSRLAVAVWWAVLCFANQAAADGAGPPGAVAFDIAAQPLATALSALSTATRIPIFVDAEMMAGRRSVEIKGVFTPDAALNRLLAGTGLVARFIGDRGFTLGPAPPSDVNPPSPPMSRSADRFADYSAALQSALRTVLCRDPATRPGSYRTLLRFWISMSGSIARAELLTSTGDGARDALLLAALRDATVGEAPPADLPQPTTLLLVPSAALRKGYCLEGASALGLPNTGREARAR